MFSGLRRLFTRIRDFDLLEDNIRGLRRALETQQRVIDDLHAQLVARDAQIDSLRQEYAALDRRGSDQTQASVQTERLMVFRHLQPVVTQLPTLRAALAQGADLTAQDVLSLLAPLDQMLDDLGFRQVGEAGQEVPYDPRRHNAVGPGAEEISQDDYVRVRYVGYLYNDEVVCKAEVTRAEQPSRS